jgi:transcriptional regulator with XRE-family HTH domain
MELDGVALITLNCAGFKSHHLWGGTEIAVVMPTHLTDDVPERNPTNVPTCYVSRVENGHTVPAVETLEKFARALEVPMYQLFYDGEEPPKLPNLPKRKLSTTGVWGDSGKDAHTLAKFRRLFNRMGEGDLGLVLFMAQKMARR